MFFFKIIMLSIVIIQVKGLINILNNRNYKENLNCHLVNNLLRKECIRMMRFITEKKNKKENNKMKSKKNINMKIKNLIKNQILLPPMMMRFGIKSFLNKNLFKNLLLKSLLLWPNKIIIKSLKIQVLLVIRKIDNIKNHGSKMLKLNKKKIKILMVKINKKRPFLNLSIQMEMDRIQILFKCYRDKLLITTQILLLMILLNSLKQNKFSKKLYYYL